MLLLDAFVEQNENRDVPLRVQYYGAEFSGPQTGQRTSRLFRCCNQQGWNTQI